MSQQINDKLASHIGDKLVPIPKIVNDPVHGHLELSPACVAVIDTKQFQRLRFIKQTGFCYFVYPGASHNRFEHSLGVCHLAGELVKSLRNNQPEELDITPVDVLCVELAGLCHDLGHGAFSHTYDGKFIPQVNPEKILKSKWKHEQASIDMLDYLISDNKLMDPGSGIFYQYGLRENVDQKDITFIKEMIYGFKETKDKWLYKGRPEKKSFLYEIVSNNRTKIDVDKWDYFARDCHHLGIRNNFNHLRVMKFMRVLMVDGRLQICSRDKEMGNLYQMFHTRYNLHRTAYQHKVNCAIEIMMVDAMEKADPHLVFVGKDNKEYRMSNCMEDMEAYLQLTDHIFWDIFCTQSKNSEMLAAKSIVERIMKRDLYCVLDERLMSDELLAAIDRKDIDVNSMRSEIIEISKSGKTLKLADFRLQVVNLDFGMSKSNPLDLMNYYSKANPELAKRGDEKSMLRPPRFEDSLLRIYSCDSKLNDRIHYCFNELCKKNNIEEQYCWNFSVYNTPMKDNSPKKRSASASNIDTTPGLSKIKRGLPF